MNKRHFIEEQDFAVAFGDNRHLIERRQFSYSSHIPERRKGADRRNLPSIGTSRLEGREVSMAKPLTV